MRASLALRLEDAGFYLLIVDGRDVWVLYLEHVWEIGSEGFKPPISEPIGVYHNVFAIWITAASGEAVCRFQTSEIKRRGAWHEGSFVTGVKTIIRSGKKLDVWVK